MKSSEIERRSLRKNLKKRSYFFSKKELDINLVSKWLNDGIKSEDDFIYAVNLLKTEDERSTLAKSHVATCNEQGHWIAQEGIEFEKVKVALPFVKNKYEMEFIACSLVADCHNSTWLNQRWTKKEGKTKNEIEAVLEIIEGGYSALDIATAYVADYKDHHWVLKENKTTEDILEAFDLIDKANPKYVSSASRKLEIATSYILEKKEGLFHIKEGKGFAEVIETFGLIDKSESENADITKSKIIFSYVTQYDESTAKHKMRKDLDPNQVIELLNLITDPNKRRNCVIDIMNSSTIEDKEGNALFAALNQTDMVGEPIPSMLHLVWTGNKEISSEKIQDIARVASFGRDIENGEDVGLEVHLWVDDAQKFKILYNKALVDSSRAGDIEVLPKALNFVIHSISELGKNGGNGLDFDSQRGRVVEELLMKSEVNKGQGRNKPASASDIVRALILDQKGGVYCDLRVALNFIKSLKEKGLKKFGSMPDYVKSNFLSLGQENHDEGLGANYAMARPNTEETLEMLQSIHAAHFRCEADRSTFPKCKIS